MYNPRFEKARFKKDVQDNVKRLFRKELDEANPQEQFQAVSYAVKEAIIDDWIETQKKIDKEDPKIVYYMSMEFLMGRALGNNLINMTAYTEVKEALDELGIDLNTVEDQEPDPALGNGGLGRLAACFLDSLASLGLFKFRFAQGFSSESKLLMNSLVFGLEDIAETYGEPYIKIRFKESPPHVCSGENKEV